MCRSPMFVLLCTLVAGFSGPQPLRAQVTADEARQIAVEAYIYGYPLVTMEMTRRVMTNVAEPKDGHAPMGQFYNARTYPNASFRDVTAPNADTLYSTAWLDLSAEPYVLNIPDEGDRYYLMPMLDAWTNVFQVPGRRTTGNRIQSYAITGPNFKGEVPPGVTQYKSPTNLVWILGRTYCDGTPEDYKVVHDLQDKLTLVPLSLGPGADAQPAGGKVDPTIDMRTPVREQVNKLDAKAYFKLLAALMKDNPPAKEDAPIIAKMAKIGIVPGEDFDSTLLDAAAVGAIQNAPPQALEKITAHMKFAGKELNGWIFPVPAGVYRTDYLQRATIAYYGLGCNRMEDAVYPTADADSDGKPLTGAGKYTMTFPKGQLPPVNGFWSLTMYDADFFFVANSLNRYTLSQRNKLEPNADGSTTLHLQHESPGKDNESNWLPAPEGRFVLMLRMYWPKEQSPSILDGTWKPPAVVRVP